LDLIKKSKVAVRRRVDLMHSMLVATMMMVPKMMRGMDFIRQHGWKLWISTVEFQQKGK